MKISRRLGESARSVAVAARSLRGDQPADVLPPDGPAAVYARVLDGEHLWLAVRAGDGRPALRDPDTGRLVEAADTLPTTESVAGTTPDGPDGPDGAGADEPAYVAVRWRLLDTVPATADAELQLVAVRDGGRPVPLRPAPPPPPSNLRVPPTPDGEWRFQLVEDPEGFLRVRRTRAARVARLLGIAAVDGGARLTVAPPEGVAAGALLLLDRDGAVAASLPTAAGGPGSVVVEVTPARLPEAGGGYRVAVGDPGAPDEAVNVVRLRNDVHVDDHGSVLLPTLLEPETELVAGRFQFTPQGVLRLVRKELTAPDPTDDTEADAEDTGADEPDGADGAGGAGTEEDA